MSATASAGDPHVLLVTDHGEIELEVHAARAPISAANFLRYVDEGRYDGSTFYRTVTYANDNGDPRIEVIQGGLGDGVAAPFAPIDHEPTDHTGIEHTDGTISMARGAAGTAASEFFICIGAQPALDAGATRYEDRLGFAAFGRVVRGMEVVRLIHTLPSDTPVDDPYIKGQILERPVHITSARRLSEQRNGNTNDQ